VFEAKTNPMASSQAAAIQSDIGWRRPFVIAALYERRNLPVADRRYSFRMSLAAVVMYNTGKREAWRTLLREEGSEMLEVALVAPLLVGLILAIFWFGRAYNIYETITRAAREGARAAAAPSCATCGNSSLSSSQVQQVVNQMLSADDLDPANVQSFQALANQPLAGSMSCPASPAVLSSGQICGVVVSFTYPFTFHLPLTTLNVLNISTQVQMAEENP